MALSETRIAGPPPIRADADGVLRVGSSRVTLDIIVHEYRAGATPEQIQTSFPTLELADVYGAIRYYLRRQPEVDACVAEREVEAREIRQDVERRWPSAGLRERLLARIASNASEDSP